MHENLRMLTDSHVDSAHSVPQLGDRHYQRGFGMLPDSHNIIWLEKCTHEHPATSPWDRGS